MLDAFIVDIKNQKTQGSDIKLCFSFNDEKTNNSLGFYGLSYAHEYDDVGHIFSITIDDLYINKLNIDSKWEDVLYLHLTDVVFNALSNVKNQLMHKQEFDIQVAVPENPELEELLNLVVNNVCIDLSLNDRITA